MHETTAITSAIRTSKETAKIYAEICALQSELTPIPKDGVNTQQHYNYAKFDTYVQILKPILTKYNLFILTAQHEPIQMEPRQTKNNNVAIVIKICLTIRLVHQSGEWVEIDAYGEGQDYGDKALYKAITGARKYGLACLLGLGTADDPENDDIKPPKTQPQTYRKPIPPAPPNTPNYNHTLPPPNLEKQMQGYLISLENASTEEDLKKTFVTAWRNLEKNKSAQGRVKDKYEEMKKKIAKPDNTRDTQVQPNQKE